MAWYDSNPFLLMGQDLWGGINPLTGQSQDWYDTPEVRDDPERRNAKIVTYTEKGRQVNRAGARIIEQIEQRLAERLGAGRLEALRELLAEDWD